ECYSSFHFGADPAGRFPAVCSAIRCTGFPGIDRFFHYAEFFRYGCLRARACAEQNWHDGWFNGWFGLRDGRNRRSSHWDFNGCHGVYETMVVVSFLPIIGIVGLWLPRDRKIVSAS